MWGARAVPRTRGKDGRGGGGAAGGCAHGPVWGHTLLTCVAMHARCVGLWVHLRSILHHNTAGTGAQGVRAAAQSTQHGIGPADRLRSAGCHE